MEKLTEPMINRTIYRGCVSLEKRTFMEDTRGEYSRIIQHEGSGRVKFAREVYLLGGRRIDTRDSRASECPFNSRNVLPVSACRDQTIRGEIGCA